MKPVLFICFSLLLLTGNAYSQDEAVAAKENAESQIAPYWFVMLKTGPKQYDSIAKAKLFEGHMENMDRLHKEGILKVAGPFGKNELKWRGVFILDCKSLEEAKKHVETDPAIKAGLFAVDIVQWFTSPTQSFKPGVPEKN